MNADDADAGPIDAGPISVQVSVNVTVTTPTGTSTTSTQPQTDPDQTVWVAESGRGKSWHVRQMCGTMKRSRAVNIAHAAASGYSRCKVCG